MQNELFDKTEGFDFDKLDKIPTAALNEITQPETNALANELAAHTLSENDATQANIPPLQNNGLNGPANPAQSLKVGNIVDAGLITDLMDVAMPLVIVLIIEKVSDNTANKSSLKLSAKEKETIKPVLQNYLNSINFTVESPLNALLLTVGVIYASKIPEAIQPAPEARQKAIKKSPGISSAPVQRIPVVKTQPETTGKFRVVKRKNADGTVKVYKYPIK